MEDVKTRLKSAKETKAALDKEKADLTFQQSHLDMEKKKLQRRVKVCPIFTNYKCLCLDSFCLVVSL